MYYLPSKMKWWAAVVFAGTFAVVQGLDLSFPPGFKFGAATAAYQIEGAWNVSDKTRHIWDTFAHTEGKVLNGDTGDVACDSYHLWRRDIEMIKELGLDFYRFSLSWTRILPKGFATVISEDGKRYYNDLINGLLEAGIEPVVTLYHWDLPQNLQDLGGWTNPLVVDWFEDYARVVYQLFGDRVKTWITINEAIVVCALGYGYGYFAPGINNPEVGHYVCNKHILLAHAKAYRVWDQEYRANYGGKVSMANSYLWFEAFSPEEEELTELVREYGYGIWCHPIMSKDGGWPPALEKKMAEISKAQGYSFNKLPAFNEAEKELVKGTADYLGVNHYTSRLIRALKPNEEAQDWPLLGVPELSAAYEYSQDWEQASSFWFQVNPPGIRKTLKYLKEQYGDIEILITENGYSSERGGSRNDYERTNYYKTYLEQVLLAIQEDGVKVTGYTAWSLMDNFEWAEGYLSNFGLYEVDFSDPERPRTPRLSAEYYASIVKTRSLDVPYPPNDIKEEI